MTTPTRHANHEKKMEIAFVCVCVCRYIARTKHVGRLHSASQNGSAKRSHRCNCVHPSAPCMPRVWVHAIYDTLFSQSLQFNIH